MTLDDLTHRANEIALRLTERRPITWNALVDRWARFVADVEGGYQLTIYDYHNDLDVRGAIEEVTGRLPDDRPALERDVRELDDRFLAATREGTEVITTFDRGFGARRVPIKLVGELAADISRPTSAE